MIITCWNICSDLFYSLYFGKLEYTEVLPSGLAGLVLGACRPPAAQHLARPTAQLPGQSVALLPETAEPGHLPTPALESRGFEHFRLCCDPEEPPLAPPASEVWRSGGARPSRSAGRLGAAVGKPRDALDPQPTHRQLLGGSPSGTAEMLASPGQEGSSALPSPSLLMLRGGGLPRFAPAECGISDHHPSKLHVAATRE